MYILGAFQDILFLLNLILNSEIYSISPLNVV